MTKFLAIEGPGDVDGKGGKKPFLPSSDAASFAV